LGSATRGVIQTWIEIAEIQESLSSELQIKSRGPTRYDCSLDKKTWKEFTKRLRNTDVALEDE
jgi:hypothetical protein